MKNKRAQVTIFVIAGILIVALVLMFFLLRPEKEPDPDSKPQENPGSFLQSCLKDSIREAVDEIGIKGGSKNPSISILSNFRGPITSVAYLCYQNEDFLSCVNQEPLLYKHLQEEIYDYIEEDVDACFNLMVQSFDKQGYTVTVRAGDFSVNIIPKKVLVNISHEVTITKTGEVSREKDFEVILPSEFYEITKAVQEIINREATSVTCEFDIAGFQLLYHDFDIDKYSQAGTEIYYIEHKKTHEKFRFAVRGCIYP